MLLGICSNADVLKVMLVVKIIIVMIRIIVPILLIVSVMLDYTRSVSDGKLSETLKLSSKKMIAAVVIFLIPTVVNFIFKAVDIDKEYYACIGNANSDGINEAYYAVAKEYVLKAKESLKASDYNYALTYVNKLKNGDGKDELLNLLSDIKSYVEISANIDLLTTDNYKELSEKIENAIADIEDSEIKEKMEELFSDKKDSIMVVADYPVVPFGENDLYKHLKYMSNISLSSVLEKNNSSVEELNEKIEIAVERAGVGTREAVVAAATTLIGTIAEYGYKLPYYWGGRKSSMGVNGNWGLYKESKYCGSASDPDYCKKSMSYQGLDCEGFVNWVIVQATQKSASTSETRSGSNVALNSKTAEKAVCKVGDALLCSGHITIIIGLDDENKRYIIAEESSGLEIQSIPYNGYRKSDGRQYYCRKLDHNYTD